VVKKEVKDLQDWAAVQKLRKKNKKVAEIARALGMSRTTVYKLLAMDEEPVYTRSDYPCKVDAYREQIIEWRYNTEYDFNGANNNQDYSILVNEIYRLREEKEAALAKNAGFASQKLRMAEMTKFLKEQKSTIQEYDEQIVRKLIEKITVYDKKVTVAFKSEMEIDVEI
jgi:AraC-like DNA-binding protein